MTDLASRSSPLVSLSDQIACVRREIAMRKSVYPRLVQSRRMKQETADRELRSMEAVLETLLKAQTAARWEA